MKKYRMFAMVALGCAMIGLVSACSDVAGEADESWGSFTADKMYSHEP